MFETPAQLQSYWFRLLGDFEGHWLKDMPERWPQSIPVVIWGDEGSLNGSSWMICSWSLDVVKSNSPFVGVEGGSSSKKSQITIRFVLRSPQNKDTRPEHFPN